MKKLLFASCFAISAIFATDVTVSPIPDTMPQEMPVDPQIDIHYQKTFTKTVLYILGGLGSIFVLMIVMKRITTVRYSTGNQTSHMKIIERRAISPKTVLYLVQIGDKKIVLGESQLEIKRLIELE